MTAINRPLNDDERRLMCWLAIRVVMDQTGISVQQAADVLDTFTETGKAVLVGDDSEVQLLVAGQSLVRADRDWLAFQASFGDYDPMIDGRYGEGDDPDAA